MFTSRDPLDGVSGTPTATNPYHYADNDPLNKTDPLGLRPIDAIFLVEDGRSIGDCAVDYLEQRLAALPYDPVLNPTAAGLRFWGGMLDDPGGTLSGMIPIWGPLNEINEAPDLCGELIAASGLAEDMFLLTLGAYFGAGAGSPGGGQALSQADLTVSQAGNFSRYVKKLPVKSETPSIARLPDGKVQFTATVPGNVPGSYALYIKTVDSSGTTVGYIKVTYAPDGSIVHIKDKLE